VDALVAQVEERRDAGIGVDDDRAAAAAIAAVGAPVGRELLAPEADAARPSRAGADVDTDLVDEPDGVELLGVDGDALAVATVALELHDAVDQRKQGEVAAEADVLAGVEVRSALPNEDVAGADGLAVEALDSATLGV